MSTLPAEMEEGRRLVSERYLAGDGIEIGALHRPLPLSAAARVKYVDRLDLPGLRHNYPELKNFPFVPVDIIADGEILARLPDGQLDFIIASHVLEHTENPLGTIRNHLRKLRPGGWIYYGVPCRECGFDINRPLTTFEHLVQDDVLGPATSRWDHYLEYSRLVHKIDDPEAAQADARHLMNAKYSIHFHVWNLESFEPFLRRAQVHLKIPFMIDYYAPNGLEVIAILRKPL